MKLFKIVLTGGPSSGKKSAAYYLRDKYTKIGYKVYIIDQIICDLKYSSQPAEFDLGFDNRYSKLYTTQITTENVIGIQAVDAGDENVLIICLGGLGDLAGYMSPAEFYAFRRYNKISEKDIMDRYDAVIQLRSASSFSYALFDDVSYDKNITAEDAVKTDIYCERSWKNHPEFYIVDAQEDFTEKMHDLCETVATITSSKPYTYTDAYLIQSPDLNGKGKMEIGKSTTYFFQNRSVSEIITEKETYYRYIDGDSIRDVTKRDYLEGISHADSPKRKIGIDSFGFSSGENYFTILFYENIKDKAVLLVEKQNNNSNVVLPEYITIIKKIKKIDDTKGIFLPNREIFPNGEIE